jgi:hypothetical protein
LRFLSVTLVTVSVASGKILTVEEPLFLIDSLSFVHFILLSLSLGVLPDVSYNVAGNIGVPIVVDAGADGVGVSGLYGLLGDVVGAVVGFVVGASVGRAVVG